DVGLFLLDQKSLPTSYRYCLPNKLFEYTMARLPMVVTDLPELRNLVECYRIGFVVNPSDIGAVVERLRSVLHDKALRANLGNNLEEAAQSLSWEAEEDKLIDLYCQLLAGRMTEAPADGGRRSD